MARDLEDYDCMGNSDPVCPHCGAEWPLSKNDRSIDISYVEGEETECKCDECGKAFVAVTEVRYVYSTAIDSEHASDELWGPQEPYEAELETAN